MHPFGINVDILSVTRDRHGDEVTSRVGTLSNYAFAPGSSTEDNDNRAQTATTAELYGPPPDFPITSQHRARLPGGEMWHVDGAPQRWDKPFSGGAAGVVIRIRRVTG